MGKQKANSLARFFDKKVAFQGKFEAGQRESLAAMTEAQQGIVSELDATTDYLVLSDLAAGKTAQKKVATLNSKGAAIHVLDAAAFEQLVKPTAQEVVALIHAGSRNADLLQKALGLPAQDYRVARRERSILELSGESFEKVDLSGFDFTGIAFRDCSFDGAQLSDTTFLLTTNCSFAGTTGENLELGDVQMSRFANARLERVRVSSLLGGVDFSGATLNGAAFDEHFWASRVIKPLSPNGPVFRGAVLRGVLFEQSILNEPDFAQSDLSDSIFSRCKLQEASFQKANLRHAVMVDSQLVKADFREADLRGANLADADLTGARFNDADLQGCNLRGAILNGVNLAKAKNYDRNDLPRGTVGPALKELDQIVQKAAQVLVKVRVRRSDADKDAEVQIDFRYLKYDFGLTLPERMPRTFRPNRNQAMFSESMMQLASVLADWQIRYETLDVASKKSPTSGKALYQLILEGFAEAFGRALPPADQLAADTKAWREELREQTAADRERREIAAKASASHKATQKQQAAQKVATEVGKVTDIGSFLKALALRVEKPKIDKATKMLKASGFELFNDITSEHLSGIVKSQTDQDLVYACRIDESGRYACCTQNLNVCGGLRGSVCKHLLVLIIGLVKAGQLDPSTIDGWVAGTHDGKPELDKDLMGEIFLKYKGAEAGEVDWRPTETLPEDFYAL